ncbi:hypothetical protein [Hymenobacter sp. B1770]|uniref:hypothetical protein n=1 Tax=Hymenobacter sp. B1770 TaxID=1718788 RepID=UPI003CF245CE
MKTLLLILSGSICSVAQAQTTPTTETQALARQINQLMRDPQKPKQELTLTLAGCHAEQLIRDRGADVQTSQPLAVSFNRGDSGWAMKMDNGVFEMKMSFEWANVTALTYEPTTNDKGQKHFNIKLNNQKKGSNTSFSLPLFTTNEAVVKDVTARLEKVRQRCQH